VAARRRTACQITSVARASTAALVLPKFRYRAGRGTTGVGQGAVPSRRVAAWRIIARVRHTKQRQLPEDIGSA